MSDADIIIANLNRRIAATQAYIDRHIAPKAEPERDLAHERDMEQLRKEQLRQEDFDDEELLPGQHVEDPWLDFPLSAEGAEDFPF